ncbi:unnamed protein product [Dovyalis caffra]|uniref:Uncharacterized protein n=1 Tax=Dovyalis caffra TaxID=77055 RepID=A0AAV1SFW7_9ROSI|nr:unnamed protein product [Dovyalis caffra]
MAVLLSPYCNGVADWLVNCIEDLALMGDPSSSETTLAWIWVIEYLASLPHIEMSVLRDLIDAAPELPDDLGKNMREMVALRCLGDLFGSSDEITNYVPCREQKIIFDFSESCEFVLESILKEISESDIRPEPSKWDIHSFIMHKRATMPKCALEEVKDAILEGTHPYALLKEHSGLVSANDRRNRNSADNGNLNAMRANPNSNNSDL